ncbi:MAG: hypothetical protein AMXMBFR33_46430 [Candidatus Xenobia bacterium]
MTDVRKLIARLSAAEQNLTRFLAPCLPGGRVRTRVQGLVCEFEPPAGFEGWGVFAPEGRAARLLEPADPIAVSEYLALFPAMRVRLIHPVAGRSWLAYPVNESDARQRLGQARPLVVHLVDEGARLEVAVARLEGGALWFDQLDRKADPLEAAVLNESLESEVLPEHLSGKGLTPEMRIAYELAASQESFFQETLRLRNEHERLRQALRVGGGNLRSYIDRGDHWVVEWTDGQGQRHSSAIGKADLTVLSAGICLAGEDQRFDLQSLVGVVEGNW